AGESPPEGVIIHYGPAEGRGEGEVGTVMIKDARGAAVRTVTRGGTMARKAPAQAGMNRLVWDFRYDPPAPLERDKEPEGIGAVIEAWFGRMLPPAAVPGRYTATLEKGGESQTVEFEILPD